ncbi:MAG: hypothetical protein ABW123_06655 [Cystobacter sp.]
MSLVKELYEPYVLSARARISTDPVMRRLVDPTIAPEVLERFFIQFHAFGVYMTEPLEGWNRRAGHRSLLQSLDTLGKSLLAHARQASSLHLTMTEDVQVLVRRWNQRYRPVLHAERLLSQYPTDAMRAYRRLVEETLTGELPPAQIAIEFELSHLMQMLGPHLLANGARVLGREAIEGLGSLKEQASPDAPRAVNQARLMEELVRTMPENARTLAELGAEAIELHLRFIEDSLESAEAALGTPLLTTVSVA